LGTADTSARLRRKRAEELLVSVVRMSILAALNRSAQVKIKVVVHEAEEGGFWAEVPAIPGCATQGETMDELLRNLHEAIEGCLSIDVPEPEPDDKSRILEIAL
jgi:predicted RNase H-like HicB family nuclease